MSNPALEFGSFSLKDLKAFAANKGLTPASLRLKESVIHAIAESGASADDLRLFLRGPGPTAEAGGQASVPQQQVPPPALGHTQTTSDDDATSFFAELAERSSRSIESQGPTGDELAALVLRFVQRRDLDFTPMERRTTLQHLLQAAGTVSTKSPKEVSADDKRVLQQCRFLLGAPQSAVSDAALFGACVIAAHTLSRLYAVSLRFTSSEMECARLMEIIRRSSTDVDQVVVAQHLTMATRAMVPDSVVRQPELRKPQQSFRPQFSGRKRPAERQLRPTPEKKLAIPVCNHCKRRGHVVSDCWMLHPEKRPANAGHGLRS